MIMPATPAGPLSTPSLQCMEIWGGNEAVESAISVPGIDAWIFSQPYAGSNKGGDVYYVSTCACGEIARFAIADVSGHGDAVGELSSRLRSLIRKHINKLDQTKMARALNYEFGKLAAEGKFATGILASYHAPTDHLVIVNAGHPTPLWYRARLRTWQELQQDIPDRVGQLSNLPLGMIDSTSYHQFAVKLEKGDLVLIYTDALVEAENPNGKLLGPQGLMKSVRQLDVQAPGKFCSSLLECVAAYRGHNPPNDDVTVLLLHHNGAKPPKPSLAHKLKAMGKMIGLIKI
ncbi:MAG: serine/threonine-protein phosphatase [Planctomycetes bacterium]|nr:serine/threonine-protein phosphatase [Planctomycetota bacterium]